MADEYDYGSLWSSTFTVPPTVEGGIYVYEGDGLDPWPDGTPPKDDPLRRLWVPPSENGRDRDGPRGSRAGPGGPREGFSGARYARGESGVAYPGYRGLTSSREARPGIEGMMWDPRPPHFNPNAGNDEAHLYVDPADRGIPPFWGEAQAAMWPRVESFSGGNARGAAGGSGSGSGGGGGARGPFDHPVIVMIFILIVFLAIIQAMLRQSEKRTLRKVRKLLAAGAAAAARPT